jgi:hypothetical protein
MAQYADIRPIKELDALNTILSAGGIAPLNSSDDHASAVQVDVLMADDFMRSNMVAVQSHGWRFNTVFSHRIGVNSCGEFVVPRASSTAGLWGTSLLNFEMTLRTDQQGPVEQEPSTGGYATLPKRLDLVTWPLAAYNTSDTGDELLFYDRITGMTSFGTTAATTELSSNSSGTPGTGGVRDQIFVDAVWAVDFETCPQSFRTFVTMLSARQFAQRVVGDAEAAGFTEKDLAAAWVELEDDQGEPEELNIMDSMDVARMLGGRPRSGIAGGHGIRYA